MPEYSAAPFVGQRLDRAMQRLLPDFGLRVMRRLIASGQVLVNGSTVSPAYKLRTRDAIALAMSSSASLEPPPLLATQGDYFFYYKRSGLHTARIIGGGESLEGTLGETMAEPPRLLQRLDRDTAGIVLAAATGAACMAYRREELADHCRKWYLAVVAGHMREARWARNVLVCNGGKSVRIKAAEADSGLWTSFRPLAFGDDSTLVAAGIGRGQRHQIRAHAAALGYPLRGDRLYGDPSPGGFILEHCSLSFPGHHLTYLHPNSPLRQLFPVETELWLEKQERSCM